MAECPADKRLPETNRLSGFQLVEFAQFHVEFVTQFGREPAKNGVELGNGRRIGHSGALDDGASGLDGG